MQIENNAKKKKEKIIILVIALFLILIATYFIELNQNNKEDTNNVISSDKVKIYSKNTNEKVEWNNYDTIVVEPGDIDAVSYSFDGGLNWQSSNEYTITNNGRFNIVIKDKRGNVTAAVSYTVNTIDNIAPVITVDLPSQISINDNIDLKNFVTATDDFSGIDGEITISPRVIDTTSLGTKIINYSIKDKAGNKTSINVSVDIVESLDETIDSTNSNDSNEQNNSNNQNSSNNSSSSNSSTPSLEKYVTMYRYRVKKTNTYTCKTYDCSYYTNTTIEKTKKYVETGKCNNSYNKTLTFNNGCYIIPGVLNATCTQAITKKERYSLYQDNYIDIIALLKDGKQVDNWSSSISKENSTSPITQSSLNDIYKTEPCGENEMSIYGYCHAICSKPTYTCPSGYQLVNGNCKKYVSKTCSDTCTNYTWSEWSSWSESKVIANDEIQVESKVVKK